MPPRVVSLLPSNTEIVCALGREETLVGRSHECDYPPSIRNLPACTSSQIDSEASSRAIDEEVKRSLSRGLSLYQVDESLLADLRPDVILTQAQCEVCAVSLSDVERAVAQLVATQPKLVSLAPQTLADAWSNIQTVAEALDAADEGRQLAARLRERMEAVAARTALLERPRVVCLEWLDPLMSAGNWVPELVERAGGRELFGTAGEHSGWLTWPQLQEADPDVLILLPCGFDLERTRQEAATLAEHPEWQQLRAVQTDRVYLTDGNQYFNRPGPRLVESAEILAEILHPECAELAFGHRDVSWVRFQ